MIETVDHMGNKWRSVKEMCDHYGVKTAVFRRRIGTGMSLEDALSAQNDNRCKAVKDHTGKEFVSMKEMAKAYGMKYSTLQYRLTFMDLESALTNSVRPKRKPRKKAKKTM